LCLVNDILDYTKLSFNKDLKLHSDDIDIIEFTDEIIKMMSFQAQSRKLEFTVEYESNLPWTFITDSKRLKQMLVNLIGNAIKYTFKGSVKLIVSRYYDETQKNFEMI